MISEPELLRRARAFDRLALAEIYDHYSPGLYRYAFRLLGNADHAEECIAEVFSRFLHALRDGGGPHDHLQAYLYRMAHNWVTDQWRRQSPAQVALPSNLSDQGDGDPAELTMRQLDQSQVRAALVQLTADQRQVIMLKYVEDWENAEIASALGKPVGAIKSLQFRALAALRRTLNRSAEDESS